jgi:hypothetical protein
MNTNLRFLGGHTARKRRVPGAVQFYTNEIAFTATDAPNTLKDLMAIAKKGFNRMKKSGNSFTMVSHKCDYGLVQIDGNQVLVDLSGDNYVSKWTFEII